MKISKVVGSQVSSQVNGIQFGEEIAAGSVGPARWKGDEWNEGNAFS